VNLAVSAPAWLALCLILILVAAAIEDCWRLQISDAFPLSVALGAAIAVLLAGVHWPLWQNFAMMGAMLGLGTLLFARGAMGGGDVKLLAALALWFGPLGGLRMLVAVAIVGGVEAIVVTLLRLLPWPDAQRQQLALIRRGEPLPYGMAIAIGGIITVVAMR